MSQEGNTSSRDSASNSKEMDKGPVQLNKMIINQKGLSTLNLGGQLLQSVPCGRQGFNVFILTPAQLKDLGLVAKMKNGKPIIVHENKDGTDGVIAAATTDVPSSSKPDGEVMCISSKSPPLKASADANVRQATGMKRRLSEDSSSFQYTPEKQVKNSELVEGGNILKKDGVAASADALPSSMELWRYETRRHLPRFADHWELALTEIGYINCPMMSCNYISLSKEDMVSHYMCCDGKSSISMHACPVCMYRLGTEKDLKAHMVKSHPGDGFHVKTLQNVTVKGDWELKPKLKLLPKRRSFCKVHKVSWNIAIESKGYVKCLFQNCSYLALTVDEMIKHYGICNGGGSNGDFSCPFTCPYCKGCVETAEKLEKHIHISHTNEASESFPSSSYGTERSLSPVEVFEPETQTQGNSSRLQDSFFITLDPSNSSDNEDNHFQFVCVDGIKVEKDVEECPSTQQLPAQSVTKERIQQTVPGTRQEIRESYEVVIEQVEDVADDGISVSEEQPDVSIQVVKSEVLDDMTDGDSWTTESADTSSQLFSIVPEQSDSDLCIYSDDSQFHQPVSISKPVQEHGSSETGSWIVKTYSRRKSKLQSDELCEPPSRYLSKQTSHISRQM